MDIRNCPQYRKSHKCIADTFTYLGIFYSWATVRGYLDKFNWLHIFGSISVVKCHKVDVVTSVLGHILFWRVARMTAYVYPICGSNGIVIVTILAFAVLFWTATKSSLTGNKLRASNTNPNVFPETKTPALRSNVASRCEWIFSILFLLLIFSQHGCVAYVKQL